MDEQGVQSNWVRTALVNLIELLSFVGHLTHLQYTALGCAYAVHNMAVMLWVSSVFVLSVADLGTKQCPLNWKLAPGTAMSWQHCSKSKLLAPLTTYIHFSLPRCYVSLQMHVAILTSSPCLWTISHCSSKSSNEKLLGTTKAPEARRSTKWHEMATQQNRVLDIDEFRLPVL